MSSLILIHFYFFCFLFYSIYSEINFIKYTFSMTDGTLEQSRHELYTKNGKIFPVIGGGFFKTLATCFIAATWIKVFLLRPLVWHTLYFSHLTVAGFKSQFIPAVSKQRLGWQRTFKKNGLSECVYVRGYVVLCTMAVPFPFLTASPSSKWITLKGLKMEIYRNHFALFEAWPKIDCAAIQLIGSRPRSFNRLFFCLRVVLFILYI